MQFYELREKKELFSLKYGDIYWSKEGGWEEKNYIFLDSISIQEKWIATDDFQILELGFGAGINFLATLNAWKKQETTNHSLTYISIEENPLPKNVLQDIYRSLNLPEDLYTDFLNSYLFLETGSHSFSFLNGTVNLQLLVGKANSLLKELKTEVHVLYLDGFSPMKNPEIWSLEIFRELYRICREDGIFTTYSTASMVKENATSAGFEIQKCKGFGTKKWMLHGFKKGKKPEILYHPYYSISNLKIFKKVDSIVVGGGLAGTAIAKTLAQRKHKVLLLEREENLAMKTSGNPAGIVNPNITADRSSISLLELNAYWHLQRTLKEYESRRGFRYEKVGLLTVTEDLEKKRKGIESHNIQSLFKNKIDTFLNREGIYMPSGVWIDPVSLCSTNIFSTEDSNPIQLEFNTNVLHFFYQNNVWNIEDINGKRYQSEILILANSIDSQLFDLTKWLPIRKFRGQIVYLNSEIFPYSLEHIYILEDGYLIPQKNYTILGATYQKDAEDLNINLSDTISLMEKIQFQFQLPNPIAYKKIPGRAGIRATTPDHLPIVGPAPDETYFESEYEDLYKGGRGIGKGIAKYHDGLYLFTGFGSKGLLYTNYLAEVLANIIENKFTGLENHLLEAILPNRFLVRRLNKRKGYT